MKILLSILSIFFLLDLFVDNYDFKKIYYNNIQEYNDIEDNKRLKIFEKFTRINISKYNHSTIIRGNHQIDCWKSKSNNISKIIKVTSRISVDTIYDEKNINGSIEDQYRLKTTFLFTTFQFTQKNKPYKYTYSTTGDIQILDEYSIDNKKYSIANELGIIGIDLIYNKTKKEIRTILKYYN